MKLLLWEPVQNLEMQHQLGLRVEEAPDFAIDDVHEQATAVEDENGHRMENAYGEFTWSFSLPPKSDSTKPKNIGIKAE